MISFLSRLLVLGLLLALPACGTMDPADSSIEESSAELKTAGTYYLGRPDFRKCAFPACGGYWVRRANFPNTKCLDGTWHTECYVSTLDLAGLAVGQVLSDKVRAGFGSGGVVLRGKLVAGGNGSSKLAVSEAWMSASYGAPKQGDLLYRGSPSGIVCIKAPCPALHVVKLNSSKAANLHGADVSKVPGTSADRAALEDDLYTKNALLAGHFLSGNWGHVLVASQGWRRVVPAGALCGGGNDDACGPGTLCCLPCGIVPLNGNACHNRCFATSDDHCPLFQ